MFIDALSGRRYQTLSLRLAPTGSPCNIRLGQSRTRPFTMTVTTQRRDRFSRTGLCYVHKSEVFLKTFYCGDSPNPRITICAVVCSVGQVIEVIPAATATFCEPLAV